MGADIVTTAERRFGSKWETLPVHYNYRNYGLFGWLADVRNYSAIPTLQAERLGFPERATLESIDVHEANHSVTWFAVADLLAFDYDQPVEDRRVTREEHPGFFNGAATAEPGGGQMTTYREFLGEGWFEFLTALQSAGAERIIVSFN